MMSSKLKLNRETNKANIVQFNLGNDPISFHGVGWVSLPLAVYYMVVYIRPEIMIILRVYWSSTTN